MEPAVQEKFEYLESFLGQFIVQSDTSLSRLEKNISALSMELREQEKEPDTVSFLSKIYEKGFSSKDILSLYRLVDWLMMLPDDLTNQFTENLIAYEEEQKMPYVTSAERIGIEKGRLEGRSEGMDKGQLNEAREMVLEALDTKFSNNVPADIHKQIKDLNNRIMLRKLLRSTIQSKDISDFRKTLEEITAEDPA